MAPCTYVRHARGVAHDGCIRFGSLEFADANGPTPAFSLLPGDAVHWGARLHSQPPRSMDTTPPHTPTLDLGPARIGPVIVDSNVLACRIDALPRDKS